MQNFRERAICEVPILGILGSSHSKNSSNFALTEFSEVRQEHQPLKIRCLAYVSASLTEYDVLVT